MSRDPRTDPKPGDVIQAWPRIEGGAPPSPLTVTDVDDAFVTWKRRGKEIKTARRHWEDADLTLIEARED